MLSKQCRLALPLSACHSASVCLQHSNHASADSTIELDNPVPTVRCHKYIPEFNALWSQNGRLPAIAIIHSEYAIAPPKTDDRNPFAQCSTMGPGMSSAA